MNDDEYLILDTRPGSDFATWWRPDGNGYTRMLDQAGVYSREKAFALHRSRSTDVPVPKRIAEQVAFRAVYVEQLDDAMREAAANAAAIPRQPDSR